MNKELCTGDACVRHQVCCHKDSCAWSGKMAAELPSLIGKVGGYGGHPRQFTREESDACFDSNGRYNPAKAAAIYRGMMSEANYE